MISTKSSKHVIIDLRDALRLATGTETQGKLDGLEKLGEILFESKASLLEYGYHKVVLKELLKLIAFEENDTLDKTLMLILNHFADEHENQDEIMEALLYRYVNSTNDSVSLLCLSSISETIDRMGDNVAKHSKQLLELTNITLPTEASDKVEEILLKLELKVPKRRAL